MFVFEVLRNSLVLFVESFSFLLAIVEAVSVTFFLWSCMVQSLKLLSSLPQLHIPLGRTLSLCFGLDVFLRQMSFFFSHEDSPLSDESHD